MKKITWMLCFVFITNAFFGQQQKYHRVKIETGAEGLKKLASYGVAVDHGEYKKGISFTGEFCDNELALIQQSGLSYKILISDLSKFYAERNKNISKTASVLSDCKNCADYPTPSNFTLGSMGGFYTYQELLDVLDSMHAKFPALISPRAVIDTGHTWEGRVIYYMRMSNNPAVNQNKPQVLFTSLHHAREPESLTQLVYYMWYLLEHYNASAEIKYLVDNLEFYFIPCVNPDGYIYNYTTNPNGGGLWRKNRRNNGDGTYGVDLNRNYGYNWGADNVGSSPTTSSDTYRGPSAFSEPETQMVRNFCNAHTFRLAVNNHTYSNVLVRPDGPDSLTFTAFSEKMTYCDGFGFGDDMETVGYTTNGNSDEWMYSDVTLHPKMFAMTPEAGSVDDGFYPQQSNIIPIAAYTMDQNINAARLTAAYAKLTDISGPFIQQGGYISYSIQRLGLQPATFSVSITPLGSNFQSVGSGKTYSGLAELQLQNDSIPFSLVSGLIAGTPVKFLLNINNGGYTLSDTITRIFGTPVTVFTDNCSNLTKWTGNWGNSSIKYVSPSKSITDSPTGNYADNSDKKMSTVQSIDLTNSVAAYLEYYAQWQLEKNYDYTELKISTDGTNYSPLCTDYTHNGNSNQDEGQPLYDGFQKTWVKEMVDLSAYLGQHIWLRFELVADQGTTYDGFYFDDVLVRKIASLQNGINTVQNDKTFSLYPNPSSGKFYVSLKRDSEIKLTISNMLGEIIYNKDIKENTEIDLTGVSAGTYFVRVENEKETYIRKLIINQ